jgi:hypothetical protein
MSSGYRRYASLHSSMPFLLGKGESQMGIDTLELFSRWCDSPRILKYYLTDFAELDGLRSSTHISIKLLLYLIQKILNLITPSKILGYNGSSFYHNFILCLRCIKHKCWIYDVPEIFPRMR